MLTALFKMSFFVHFSFLGFFLQFPFFQRCFWIGSQNSKITKYESNKNQKQQEEENKIQSKHKSNMMIQNKEDNKQKKKNNITS